MEKPNIIIIFCDDLGYGDLGCFGSKANKTPRIDKMAEEGMVLTDFYAAPLSSPSRASLMTGCYPKRVGLAEGCNFPVLMPGDPIGLNPRETTLPKVLKSAGYKTKIIGKWHLGDQPQFMPLNQGFDSYFGLPYSNDMLPDNDRRDFPPLPLIENETIIEQEPNQASLTDRYTIEAIRFIKENKDNPFFLYFSHMYVHVPIYAPLKYLRKSQNGPYGTAVEHIDFSTGIILDALEKTGIDDNTIVIFTSDNGSNCKGGGSNAPLRGAKGSTWEGGMRQPCIVRWPKRIEQGKVCSAVTSIMDLLPTLANISESDMPTDNIIDGKDITELLLGNSRESGREALFYYGGNDLNAVRKGKWKLHIEQNLLYDLGKDMGETENLYDMYPAVVAELEEYAEACRKDLGDGRTGIEGDNCRLAGRVENPKTLLPKKIRDPYFLSEYD